MSYFETKMHQILISWPGLSPRPAEGAHSALPDPQLDLSGPTSQRSEESGMEKGREGG